MRMSGRDLELKNRTEVVIRTIGATETSKLLKFVKQIYHKNDMLELTPNEIKEIKVRKARKKIKEYEKAKRQIMLGDVLSKSTTSYILFGD